MAYYAERDYDREYDNAVLDRTGAGANDLYAPLTDEEKDVIAKFQRESTMRKNARTTQDEAAIRELTAKVEDLKKLRDQADLDQATDAAAWLNGRVNILLCQVQNIRAEMGLRATVTRRARVPAAPILHGAARRLQRRAW